MQSEIKFQGLFRLLKDHVFQEEPPPGLYPTSPTVCSCGATPGTRPPEGDEAWWAAHVSSLYDPKAEI